MACPLRPYQSREDENDGQQEARYGSTLHQSTHRLVYRVFVESKAENHSHKQPTSEQQNFLK